MKIISRIVLIAFFLYFSYPSAYSQSVGDLGAQASSISRTIQSRINFPESKYKSIYDLNMFFLLEIKALGPKPARGTTAHASWAAKYNKAIENRKTGFVTVLSPEELNKLTKGQRGK